MSTPTQADRERAATYAKDEYTAERIIAGNLDGHLIVQDFTAHRIAAEAPLIAEIARKDAALRAIVDLPFTPAPTKRPASEIARAALEPVKEADDE